MVAQSSFDVRADEVAVICRDVGVKRLELVGSAAEDIDFDPEVDEIEFLVEFLPDSRRPWMGEYTELWKRLTKLYGRCLEDVDLIQDGSPHHQQYRERLESTRTLVYEA